MRMVTTVGLNEKGKWDIISPFSDNVEQQLNLFRSLVEKAGVIQKGDKLFKYSEIYVLDSRRPLKRKRFL